MDINVVEWFDVDNPEHIAAYVYLNHHGSWPEGSIPDNVFFCPQWQLYLQNKLAEAYLREWAVKQVKGGFK